MIKKLIAMIVITLALVGCTSAPDKQPIKTPPLAFVAIDCTNHDVPTLKMTRGDGTYMVGPLSSLPEHPKAVDYYNEIMAMPNHKEWLDPNCKGI